MPGKWQGCRARLVVRDGGHGDAHAQHAHRQQLVARGPLGVERRLDRDHRRRDQDLGQLVEADRVQLQAQVPEHHVAHERRREREHLHARWPPLAQPSAWQEGGLPVSRLMVAVLTLCREKQGRLAHSLCNACLRRDRFRRAVQQMLALARVISQARGCLQSADAGRACRAASLFTSNMPTAAKSHIPAIVKALCTKVRAYTCGGRSNAFSAPAVSTEAGKASAERGWFSGAHKVEVQHAEHQLVGKHDASSRHHVEHDVAERPPVLGPEARHGCVGACPCGSGDASQSQALSWLCA